MATNFPTSLQDLDATRGAAGNKLNSPDHITHHQTNDDTVEALQTKVGIDSSAVTTSHDYKLSGVTGSDKAASLGGSETLANKTLTTPTIANLTNATHTHTNAAGGGATLTSPTIATPTLTLADSTPIADGRVGFDRTNENLVIGDGSNSQLVHMGAWISWAPTWTNFTTGDGTLDYADYVQIGSLIVFKLKFTLGSTSSMGTSPQFSLPVAPSTDYVDNDIINASVELKENGSTRRVGFANVDQTNDRCGIFALNASVTYLALSSVTSTVPFTWGTGDTIEVSGAYEAA